MDMKQAIKQLLLDEEFTDHGAEPLEVSRDELNRTVDYITLD